MTYISCFSDFAFYFYYYFLENCHTWIIISMWQNDLHTNTSRSVWPILYGLMIKMLQYKMYPAGELRCPTTALVYPAELLHISQVLCLALLSLLLFFTVRQHCSSQRKQTICDLDALASDFAELLVNFSPVSEESVSFNIICFFCACWSLVLLNFILHDS